MRSEYTSKHDIKVV